MKPANGCREHTGNLIVLSLIGGGLLAILLAIVAGLFFSQGSSSLPNWAENVLVSIATACSLKLGDALSALVALATGRQVEAFGHQLAGSAPPVMPAPPPSGSMDIPDPQFAKE